MQTARRIEDLLADPAACLSEEERDYIRMAYDEFKKELRSEVQNMSKSARYFNTLDKMVMEYVKFHGCTESEARRYCADLLQKYDNMGL